MSKLICDIVTPAAKLYSEEAYMVVVPGVEGEMGYLINHEPLVSLLADGQIRIQVESDSPEMHRYVTQGGYVEVTGQKVIVLADRACSVEDVDEAEAKRQLEELEGKLSKLDENEISKSTLPADIAWYKAQVKAVENQ